MRNKLNIVWEKFDGFRFQDMCNDLLVGENLNVVPFKSGPYADGGIDAWLPGWGDTVPHLLQSFAIHFWDSGLPSRHLVMPPIQSTPPWREQQPLQSAETDTVIVDRERAITRDMRRKCFFNL
jgi:hypothetical protein